MMVLRKALPSHRKRVTHSCFQLSRAEWEWVCIPRGVRQQVRQAHLGQCSARLGEGQQAEQRLPCPATTPYKGDSSTFLCQMASAMHTVRRSACLAPAPGVTRALPRTVNPVPPPTTPGRLQVVRSTHPPEYGPHGVASNPAPTYAKQPSMSWTGGPKKAVGPRAFNSPSHHLRPPSPARAGEG